jgi:D-alanine-D-alanine ligase
VRVTVLFNQPVLSREHPEADSELWVTTAVDGITRTLTASGFQVSRLGAGRGLIALRQQLAVNRPDVVFNLFEGLADRPETESEVTGLLEELHIPFTGSDSQALRSAVNKPLTKRCLQAAGLPTPWFRATSDPREHCETVPWPVIVKPAQRDASEGIDQGSVVTNGVALARRVSELLRHYGSPVLIEEFLPGREFTVALIETPQLVALPIAEVRFTPTSAMPWPIMSYASKWCPGTPDYESTAMDYRATLPPDISAPLVALATRAFLALGCRDYARIDLRMTQAGDPMILEVNANPDMSPSACFAGALAAAGRDRAEFVAALVHRALVRGGVLCSERCG